MRKRQKRKIKEGLELHYFEEEEARELLKRFVETRDIEHGKAFLLCLLGLLEWEADFVLKPHILGPELGHRINIQEEQEFARYLAKELSNITKANIGKYYEPDLFFRRSFRSDYAKLLAASGAPNLNEYVLKIWYGIDEKKARKIRSYL